jgi:hypothetical protein
MNNIEINQEDIKKYFTETELLVVNRFMQYLNTSQSKNFSVSNLDYETDEQIRESVRNFLADRYQKGHGKRRDQ